MKKIITIIFTIAMIMTLFSACSKNSAPTDPNESDTENTESDEATKSSYKIGIIQLVEHPSLDEIRESFIGKTESLAKEQNISVEFDYKNAQNDISLINSICRTFVDEKVDVIVAIATPTAQGAASTTTEIPIIFSAVTDPVAAGLVSNLESPTGNITGVSDAINVEEIFKLAEELTPDVKSYGLIYNKGEINSVSVIEETKKYLDEAGIGYTEKIVAYSSEVQQAARALLETNDAIFAPIDNTVASAMQVLSSEALAAGKPVYVAADSMVADGGLATAGVNYTQLGELTAEITVKVLNGTSISEIPVEVMTDISPVVNEETAAALGIDVSKYL